MKYLYLASVLMFSLNQQPVAPEAYPGQHSHKEPPPGWMCYPKTTNSSPAAKAHECDCHRIAHATPEDPICYEATADPDNTCTVWCWEKGHCLCGTGQCKMPGMRAM